ncbi:uncharacterized protein LOC120735063 isoform X3 [Simochromis diagramma]|uniref:uncharacterized protein LOC120735063 isoform X3 n=1 Tax=Simochromis diagramma TaxID=43689 RepID=UPI001A7E5308|nr:uncharacterized protein LOC120735063 isoform X3 [Simochromis diagramma]
MKSTEKTWSQFQQQVPAGSVLHLCEHQLWQRLHLHVHSRLLQVSPMSSKTFQRSVYFADVVGGRLIPNRMVVVRFLESEATLQGIVGKVQDAIGNYNPIILTDAQGNAILESEGTTGSQYWRQNARKILAVPEQDFNCLQGTKRKKLRHH